MGKENFKLLIRNLRKGKNAKLKIQTTALAVRYPKSGNQFSFQSRLNLITAKDNSVGKSTLVKLLFWGLGAEPELDTTWKSNDCKVLVKFSVDNDDYQVMRYKDIIYLKEGSNDFIKYTKITGDYSKKFSQIVNFRALLPNRDSNGTEVPPPAYYFIPFYIDQMRSWSKAWENFDNLGQFENWKSTIIKYHIGLLSPEHFELEEQYYEKKRNKAIIESNLTKIQATLEVVNTYTPDFVATVDEKFFLQMTEEIKVDLIDLTDKQETVLDNYAKHEGERAYLEHQRLIAKGIVSELELDYKFSVENLPADEVECPLCGTVHENSVLTRTSILTDKTQAENQLAEIEKSISILENKLSKTRSDLSKIQSQIADINSKYVIENGEQTVSLEDIIDSFAVNSIQRKVEKSRETILVDRHNINESLSEIRNAQKQLISSDLKEQINNGFIDTFTTYIAKLNAEGINISEIKSPLDYNKVVKEGGAAEKIRGILAYYLAIYSLVVRYGSEVVSALVIDTPNQQEQSKANYDKILELILTEIPSEYQVILCAMDNIQVAAFKDRANVISLDNKRLLREESYETIKLEFDIFNN